MGESTADGGVDKSGFIQDKRSRAEAKARADAQTYAKLGKSQRTESGFGRKEMGFKTVTQSRQELAERDLNRRATDGQVSKRNQQLPSVAGTFMRGVNNFGKNRAKDIQDKIAAGGTRVYDERGRIQGVVHTSNTIFGPQQVYTGSGSYDPKDTGAKIGTITGARDGTKGYQSKGPAEFGGGISDDESNVPVMRDSTGSTLSSTKMSSAAKRQRVASLGAGGGGANRRKFV